MISILHLHRYFDMYVIKHYAADVSELIDYCMHANEEYRPLSSWSINHGALLEIIFNGGTVSKLYIGIFSRTNISGQF